MLPARLLLSLGLAGILTASAALAWPDGDVGSDTRAAPPAPVAAAAVTPSDIAVAHVTYDPGQSSGWHTHPGVHAVVVLSGTLTVYGPGCTASIVGPGQSYVGGQELHLTRNETAAPVELVVTSVDTSRLSNSVSPHVAPDGCGVA